MTSQPPSSLKILFTEGSSTSAREALYSLGPRHTIDILDPSPLCQCRFSRFVRRRYWCPSFSRDPLGYLTFLARRLRAEKYDVLLPTHEQVYLLAQFQETLRMHVGIALPPFAALDRLMSKANFVRLLDELDLPRPETHILRDRSELERYGQFPCFVKLDYSTAGEGVRLVHNPEELKRVADEFQAAGWLNGVNEIVVQRPAAGNKASVTGVFQHGSLVAVHCVSSRALGVGGSSPGQRSVWHPAAVEHVARLGKHLDWHGAMVLEYCYEEQAGRPEYYECNPRMGETVNSLLSGVNVCEQLCRISLDEPVEVLDSPRLEVRTHQGYLVWLAKALEGAGRPAIAAEISRWWRGQGLYEQSEDQLTRPREDSLSALPALGIALLLLARPRAAKWLVRRTVENYSLHTTAVHQMRELSADRVASLFAA